MRLQVIEEYPCVRARDFKTAESWYKKSLEIFEKCNDEYSAVIVCKNLEKLSLSAKGILQALAFSNPDFSGFGAGVLIAAVFLLRSHIKIKRSPEGKREFLIEHKPGDNELLTRVIGSLQKLLSGNWS